jgi:hypothetical protein
VTYVAWAVLNSTTLNEIAHTTFNFVVCSEFFVIGVLLIYSVTVMVRNLSAHADGAKADLKAILVHAGAFGLWMLAIIILGVIYIARLFELLTVSDVWIGIFVNLLFEFLSSCLICVIFVVLSKPDAVAIETEG